MDVSCSRRETGRRCSRGVRQHAEAGGGVDRRLRRLVHPERQGGAGLVREAAVPARGPIVVGPGRIRVGLRAPVAEMPSTGGSIVIVDPDWKLHVARTPAVAAARH
jgi:hypothetical protein